MRHCNGVPIKFQLSLGRVNSSVLNIDLDGVVNDIGIGNFFSICWMQLKREKKKQIMLSFIQLSECY